METFYFIFSYCLVDDDSSNPYLEYVLTKSELDTAHKDKLSKLYTSEFKVNIVFNLMHTAFQ